MNCHYGPKSLQTFRKGPWPRVNYVKDQLVPWILGNYSMAQQFILLYLQFGPKVLIVKTVNIILKIFHFSPKSFQFWRFFRILNFKIIHHLLNLMGISFIYFIEACRYFIWFNILLISFNKIYLASILLIYEIYIWCKTTI